MARNTHRAQEIRNSTYGKPMRKPIVESVESKMDACDKAMDEVEARHDERVSSITATSITGQTDYCRLVLTRINGK